MQYVILRDRDTPHLILAHLELPDIHFTEEVTGPVVDVKDGGPCLVNDYVVAATAHSIPNTWLVGKLYVMLVLT